MGTEKTLEAIIQEQTGAIAPDSSPPIDYTGPAQVTYRAGRVIRDARLKLYRREHQDEIKIAVEALDGQQVFLFQLAATSSASEPPAFSNLTELTGPDTADDIAKLARFAPPRNGYRWHMFRGDYPDPQRLFFHTHIELSQMPNVASESLRFRITFRPNIWVPGNHFAVETQPFVPHQP